ncbi:hypothetical protein AYK24_05275 [Thermoplasmatales archaeon SG8-52-4]|nr:MAG: hypothetical protein AYK24_05275 [Thermoplasmatales archaeon SG8-52-4]
MNKINSLKRFEIGFVSILILLTILLVIAIPVNACYYKVGTFESDYTTYKISFFKGETVYGKGNLYDYDYFLKLRIKDPQGNIVYTSNKSQHVVYCSYLLNNTAMAGIWSIQLGVLKNNWQWSNLPGRISFFTVKKANYSLHTNVCGNGSIVKDIDQDFYEFGSIINLSAISDKGWYFCNWSGDLCGNDNIKVIIMDSNKTVTANFAQKNYYLVTNVIGNGTIEIKPFKTNYTYGSVVNLTSKPFDGWYFDHWIGNITGNDNPYFITIDNDKNITAIFNKFLFNLSIFNITINIEGNGIVNINPDKDYYTYGEIVEISAIPNSNWYFDCWSGDITGSNLSYEINITSNKFITAHFRQFEEDDDENKEIIIEGGGGSDWKLLTFEKSNIPPVADAGGPYYGLIGETITFNGSNSYDVDHYIKSFLWDFDNSLTKEGVIVTNIYSSAGKYKVILNVTDTKGKTSSNSTYAIIIEPNHPPSKPNISGPTVGFTGIKYNFSIASMDVDNNSINYLIEWADGTQNISGYLSSKQSFEINHKWIKSGIYKIIVTAEDGESSTTNELIITIYEPKNKNISETYNILLIIILILILIISLILLKIQEKDNK